MNAAMGRPPRSAAPAVIVEVAELVETALEIFRSVALFFRDAPPRHPSAPIEMPARIIVPAGALHAAAEPLVRLCLDDGHARVGVARRALALDIAARVIAAELEREAALVEAY